MSYKERMNNVCGDYQDGNKDDPEKNNKFI